METKEKKSVYYNIRYLHRNIGFFILGFVIIYAFSGIALVYRDSDFLKREKTVSVNLPAETKPADLAQALRMREFKILKTEGDVIYFQGGSFNATTGEAIYKVKELIFPFNKFSALHKTPSKNPFHFFNLLFGILMTFMAVSSFWMFKPKSKLFRNGIYIALAGFASAVILLVFLK
jgi:hypothetical protein